MDKPVKNSRFKRLVGVAIVMLTLGTGFNIEVAQQKAHQDCLLRNHRVVAAQPLLRKIVAAARDDGDEHMAKFWQDYLEQTSKTPLPKC